MAVKYDTPITATIFDLDVCEEVKLVKPFEFKPVGSTQEALARVGNDSARFLEAVNYGLYQEAREQEREKANGWHTVDEDGETNGEFKGTMADIKKVNQLQLTLAKTVFGYSKDLDSKAKASAKEAAMNMIKSTDAIRNGLKTSAAISVAPGE